MIKKEDFQKLKQLDRIEYLLELKRIEEKNKTGCVFFVIYLGMGLISFLILLSIFIFLMAGKDMVCDFMRIFFPKAVFMIILFLMVGLLVDLCYVFRFKKEKKELESEFFKQEVKPKR